MFCGHGESLGAGVVEADNRYDCIIGDGLFDGTFEQPCSLDPTRFNRATQIDHPEPIAQAHQVARACVSVL
jgi:hypothetical protein